jgi:peroxiredoxin
MRNLIILNLFFALSTIYAQEWLNEMVTKNPSLMTTPDSLVKVLSSEFQKAIGKPAPTFSYQGLENDTMKSIGDFQGEVVLVNFWSTNCAGCRYEMPDLSCLQDSLIEKGFRVLFLSPESKELLVRYFADNKISGMKGILKPNQLKQPYQILAKPSSFIVDRNGIVRDVWIGPLQMNEILKRVSPYLDAKNR